MLFINLSVNFRSKGPAKNLEQGIEKGEQKKAIETARKIWELGIRTLYIDLSKIEANLIQFTPGHKFPLKSHFYEETKC